MTRYTMDEHDYYDGDKPLRDTDLVDRLNEQDDDLDRMRADYAALRTAIERFLSANTANTIGAARAKLRQLVSTDHPGAPLLAELEAARKVVKVINTGRIREHCALCGGLDTHTATCAIGQYDASLEGNHGGY